jgi:hypothetical protein
MAHQLKKIVRPTQIASKSSNNNMVLSIKCSITVFLPCPIAKTKTIFFLLKDGIDETISMPGNNRFRGRNTSFEIRNGTGVNKATKESILPATLYTITQEHRHFAGYSPDQLKLVQVATI